MGTKHLYLTPPYQRQGYLQIVPVSLPMRFKTVAWPRLLTTKAVRQTKAVEAVEPL
jgi:hypothetical protein